MTWPPSFPILFRRRVPGEFGSQNVEAYLTPEKFGNQTGWWDMSVLASLYQDTARTSPVTADGQDVDSFGDVSGNNRHENTTAGSGLYKTNVSNGKPGLLVTPANVKYATAAPRSTFITNSAHCVFLVLKDWVSNSNEATLYQNCHLIGDASASFWGVVYKTSDGFHQYIYDDAIRDSGAVAASGPFVLTAWHTGNVSYLQKNLETPVSAAAGNIGGGGALLGLNGGYGSFYGNAGYIHEVSIHNAYAGDTKRASVIAGLMAKWGIS